MIRAFIGFVLLVAVLGLVYAFGWAPESIDLGKMVLILFLGISIGGVVLGIIQGGHPRNL